MFQGTLNYILIWLFDWITLFCLEKIPNPIQVFKIYWNDSTAKHESSNESLEACNIHAIEYVHYRSAQCLMHRPVVQTRIGGSTRTVLKLGSPNNM